MLQRPVRICFYDRLIQNLNDRCVCREEEALNVLAYYHGNGDK